MKSFLQIGLFMANLDKYLPEAHYCNNLWLSGNLTDVKTYNCRGGTVPSD